MHPLPDDNVRRLEPIRPFLHTIKPRLELCEVIEPNGVHEPSNCLITRRWLRYLTAIHNDDVGGQQCDALIPNHNRQPDRRVNGLTVKELPVHSTIKQQRTRDCFIRILCVGVEGRRRGKCIAFGIRDNQGHIPTSQVCRQRRGLDRDSIVHIRGDCTLSARYRITCNIPREGKVESIFAHRASPFGAYNTTNCLAFASGFVLLSALSKGIYYG